MEKNTKKILTFSVLALFLFAFSLQFVAAAAGDVTEELANLIDNNNPIGGWFADWETGTQFSTNIAKYLFWALVSMFIFSIAGNIPGIGTMKPGLKAIFSIVVGFLSMAYITPEEVYSMMTGYSALGFVLGGFLPLIILLFFTINIATVKKKGDAATRLGRRIMAVVLWIAFALFAAIKAVSAPKGAGFLSWVIFGASVAMILSMKSVFKLIHKELKTETKDKAKDTIEASTAKMKMDAEALEALGN